MARKEVIEKPLIISKIFIDKLFGHYTYDINVSSENESMLIIYGDNGCGKTTILQLLFHLLSTNRKSGHKTFISKIAFKEFSVFLSNGVKISVERNGEELIGNYTIFVSKENNRILRYDFDVDEKSHTRTSQINHIKELEIFLQYIDGLHLSIHFLSDERKLYSDNLITGGDEKSEKFIEDNDGNIRILNISDGEENSITNLLTQSINRYETSIKQQAYVGSSLGFVNTDKIYAGIIKEINTPRLHQNSAVSLQRISDYLSTELVRSQKFEIYGLSSTSSISEITKEINHEISSNESKSRDLMEIILDPYLESIKARHDALQGTYDNILSLVNSINQFYKDKHLEFDINSGISIISGFDGTKMKVSSLSSGEKQILIILCNMLCINDDSNVYIIDEPEISLNIKWQRIFLDTLSKCIKNNRIQLIFASHSIELLSRHSSNVQKLENTSNSEMSGDNGRAKNNR